MTRYEKHFKCQVLLWIFNVFPQVKQSSQPAVFPQTINTINTYLSVENALLQSFSLFGLAGFQEAKPLQQEDGLRRCFIISSETDQYSLNTQRFYSIQRCFSKLTVECVRYLCSNRIHYGVLQEFHHDELLQHLKILLIGLIHSL